MPVYLVDGTTGLEIHCLLFVQGERLHHPSRWLAANAALGNGLGKELSEPCFFGIFGDPQGLWQMASPKRYITMGSFSLQLECKIQESRDCVSLYALHFKKCLVHGSCPVNICGMNGLVYIHSFILSSDLFIIS